MQKEKTNIVGLWSNLGRAYQIARVGGFTIQVVYDYEYKAADDYQKIKEFYSDVTFAAKGNLVVELRPPDKTELIWAASKNQTTQITFEHLSSEVATMQNNPKPQNLYLCKASEALLKRATQHYNLDLTQVETCIKVAATIAHMHNYSTVQAEHIAEALQYSVTHLQHQVIAENNTIQFGSHITIDYNYKEPDDIHAAIAYLQSLILNQ